MTDFPRWQDVRSGIVAGAGGEEAVTEARRRNQAYIDGHRLADRRKALGLTQAQVAEKMGVTKSRVSQVERGEVSTIEVVARYVQPSAAPSRSPPSSATTTTSCAAPSPKLLDQASAAFARAARMHGCDGFEDHGRFRQSLPLAAGHEIKHHTNDI